MKLAQTSRGTQEARFTQPIALLSTYSHFPGPTIHYIDVPLAYWFMNVTAIENLMSANAVSVVGVCFATAAAREAIILSWGHKQGIRVS